MDFSLDLKLLRDDEILAVLRWIFQSWVPLYESANWLRVVRLNGGWRLSACLVKWLWIWELEVKKISNGLGSDSGRNVYLKMNKQVWRMLMS